MNDEEEMMMDADNEQLLTPLPSPPPLPQNETRQQQTNHMEDSAPPKRGIVLSWKNVGNEQIFLLKIYIPFHF